MRGDYKGAVVEWVEHPVTKRRAPIRLDKSRMTFFATVSPPELKHPKAEEATVQEPTDA